MQLEECRFTGPYTHDNLAVFLIHGTATLPGDHFLTLQEALENDLAVVHETDSVNELAIENKSSDREMFIQSGDIVKGGKQDRTFPYDFIAPPQSGRMPISSYCVEQGRWAPRKGEKYNLFLSSSFRLSSKEVKLAAVAPKGYSAQSEVWSKVQATQERLSRKLGESVKSADSESSLQLSLEHPKLQEVVEPYLKRLAPILKDRKDVVGYAVAVNGKLLSADVYASDALFKKLWPKLLRGSAVEAFAESTPRAKTPQVTGDDVKDFLAQAERGEASNEAVGERVYVPTLEGDKQVLLDTCDRKRKNLVLHRSVLAR